MEKATMKDVAKAAGVSYATVSRALSGSPEISEATRRKVLAFCEEMHFTPNVLARSMVMKRTNTIGVIVAGIDNPFMSEVTNYIEIHAREKGYNLMLCNSSYEADLEKSTLELLISRQLDGVIMIPSSNATYSEIEPLLARIPVVFLSENMNEMPVDSVCVDNAKGTQMGTEYLYSMGHRKILYLGRRKNSLTHEQRANGYINACRANGLEMSFLDSNFQRSSRQSGYHLAQYLFSKPLKHTAIYCATDSLAIGVMQAADEAGIRIPEDLSLVGFDNISFTELPRIDLTTVDQPREQLAVAALDLLLARIENPEAPPVHRVLQPTLVERTSCRMIEAEP